MRRYVAEKMVDACTLDQQQFVVDARTDSLRLLTHSNTTGK
jgi:hypothetical protein